jgi:hypothetical protein
MIAPNLRAEWRKDAEEGFISAHRFLRLLDDLADAEARAEAENERGGEARGVVHNVARTLGVDLTSAIQGGGLWSPPNMARAISAAEKLAAESGRMRALLGELGFCPKDGDSMPCETCGAGL